MHVWTLKKWAGFYDLSNPNHRTGVRLRIDKNVHSEVKRACIVFLKWLRTEYFFPIRIPIYIKSTKYIRAKDGELVSAVCFLPDEKDVEPYIRIAVGDFNELLLQRGQDNALAAILGSIVHELTHYYQWVNEVQLTYKGAERQATIYKRFILGEYAKTREHL